MSKQRCLLTQICKRKNLYLTNFGSFFLWTTAQFCIKELLVFVLTQIFLFQLFRCLYSPTCYAIHNILIKVFSLQGFLWLCRWWNPNHTMLVISKLFIAGLSFFTALGFLLYGGRQDHEHYSMFFKFLNSDTWIFYFVLLLVNQNTQIGFKTCTSEV